MQSDGFDKKSIPGSNHAQSSDNYSERVKETLREVENTREKVGRFLEMRQCGFKNETRVVFNNISVEGSGTGVSIHNQVHISTCPDKISHKQHPQFRQLPNQLLEYSVRSET